MIPNPKDINSLSAVMIIPVIYVALYFGFLKLVADTMPFAASSPPHKTIHIVTGNKPVNKIAVKIFKPAMWVHGKATETRFSIKVHMLA